MGLLALDVTGVGIVMSSDSRDVLLHEGHCEALGEIGHPSKNKILRVTNDHFVALIGYVGTEHFGKTDVRTWLDRFEKTHKHLPLRQFCEELGRELSTVWKTNALRTCMWVKIAGYEGGEARFWYVVNNSDGPAGMDDLGCYRGIKSNFRVVNDLDERYMPAYLARGLTKAETLAQISFNFRNGVLMPGSLLFDAFNTAIQAVAQNQLPDFAPFPFTLLRYAYIARQRMECLKRLHSTTHGIHSQTAVPMIDGTVNVYALAPDGTFTVNPKIVHQAKKAN